MNYAPKFGVPAGICDRCGFKFQLSMLRPEWTGLKTCHGEGTNNCWEPRPAQDFVRGVADRQTIANPRPEPEDTFLNPGDVNPADL